MRPAHPFIAFMLALTVLGPGFLFASATDAEDFRLDTVKVRADGFAEGEGRVAQAAALTAAEHVAVELVVLDLVGDRWLDRLDAVFAQTDVYVRTSRPLDVRRDADGVSVRAEVYVYDQQLRRDIAAVLFNVLPAKPRVAVLMGEQIDRYRNWTAAQGAAQRFFEGRFRDAGFIIVDAAAQYSAEVLMEYQSASPRQLAGFGRDAGADIVVRGDATAAVESPPGAVNVDRVSAKVEVDVVRPNDGLVVERFESQASVNSPDPGMGGEQAIEDAAGKIVQDVLVSSVLAFATAPPPDDFIVTVRLPSEGPWLTRARKGIGERFPKARLQDLHHKPGEARFRVALDVPLSTLVHGLTDQGFDDFAFVTERAAGRELDVELVPAQ